MSEPIQPDSGPMADATGQQAPAGTTAGGRSGRPLLIALLAVLGALVLGGGLFLLFSNLGSGGGDSTATGTTTAAPPPPVTGSPTPTLTSGTPIPTQTVGGRDPFAPIFAPINTSGVPTTGGPTTIQPTTIQPTTVQPTTVRPTTVQPTTVQPTTVKPTTVKPTSTSGNTYKLKLFEVIDNVADISVNGVDYAPRKGETFASTFQYLTNYKDGCIGILYGDQEFVICEGETVVVS